MHAITPIVVFYGRDVDTLGRGIVTAQTAVHSQPILQRQYRQHRRREHVPLNDAARNIGSAILRRLAFTMQHLMVIEPRRLTLLLPPPAHRRHVVRRGRSDREIGIT